MIKSCALISTKNGLGYILGDFFSNSSGHRAPNGSIVCVTDFSQNGFDFLRAWLAHQALSILAHELLLSFSKIFFDIYVDVQSGNFDSKVEWLL
jgi:hypothetical protein